MPVGDQPAGGQDQAPLSQLNMQEPGSFSSQAAGQRGPTRAPPLGKTSALRRAHRRHRTTPSSLEAGGQCASDAALAAPLGFRTRGCGPLGKSPPLSPRPPLVIGCGDSWCAVLALGLREHGWRARARVACPCGYFFIIMTCCASHWPFSRPVGICMWPSICLNLTLSVFILCSLSWDPTLIHL